MFNTNHSHLLWPCVVVVSSWIDELNANGVRQRGTKGTLVAVAGFSQAQRRILALLLCCVRCIEERRRHTFRERERAICVGKYPHTVARAQSCKIGVGVCGVNVC